VLGAGVVDEGGGCLSNSERVWMALLSCDEKDNDLVCLAVEDLGGEKGEN
jgi:hypothetical protein